MEEVQEESLEVVEQKPNQGNVNQEQFDNAVKARVARAAATAAEKAKAEAEAKYAAELEQLRSQAQSVGGMQQQDPEDIARKIEQKILESFEARQQQAEEDRRMQEMQNIADSYYTKLDKGRELFEDFDSVMSDFDPVAFPEIVALVANMDNTAQVMYELTKNPNKLVMISGLAKQSPKMAQAQLARLSSSISANEMAQAAEGSAQPPLNHEKSSVRAGADNGVKTVSDYKSMPFLKG